MPISDNPAISDEDSIEYVGFGVRFIATLIDAILLLLILIPLSMSIYGNNYLYSDEIIHGPADFLINWVAPAFATVLFWVYRGATPGKIIMKIRIVDERTGNNLSLGQSIGRYLAYILSAIPLCAGFFWVIFDKKQQGWHDKLAKTVVVGKSSAPEPVQFYPPT